MALWEFEIRRNDGMRWFVKVLETFNHHFTGETMRHVRFECESGTAHYDVLNEEQFRHFVQMRVM